MLVATALTAVLDGMLVVALLLPAVLRIARATGISRSVLLLPLATAATLGSHLTLIGTASNLVVSDVLAASGQPPLSLLSLTPYAAVVMVLMTLWFLGPGRKLLDKPMPEEQAAPSLGEVAVAYGLDNQLYLLRVQAESSLVGYRLDAVSLRARYGLNILAVQSARDPRITPARPELVLEQGDQLYIQAAPGELHQAANRLALEVKRPAALEELAGVDEEALRMAEVMIPVRSPLIGKTLAAGGSAGASRRFGAGRAAPGRGDPGWTGDVATWRLATRCCWRGALARCARLCAICAWWLPPIWAPLPGDVITAKARLTIAIVAGLVAVVALNLLSLAVASVVAVLLLILTGCVSAERAYRSIDGSVLVLIGAMLSLSLALEQTGAAEQIALWISAWSQERWAAVGPLPALPPHQHHHPGSGQRGGGRAGDPHRSGVGDHHGRVAAAFRHRHGLCGGHRLHHPLDRRRQPAGARAWPLHHARLRGQRSAALGVGDRRTVRDVYLADVAQGWPHPVYRRMPTYARSWHPFASMWSRPAQRVPGNPAAGSAPHQLSSIPGQSVWFVRCAIQAVR
jgi:di/tricarboxylate transporter